MGWQCHVRNTMNYSPRAHPDPDGIDDHPERRTAGGLLVVAAAVPLAIALLSGPEVILAAVVGAVVVTVLLQVLDILVRATEEHDLDVESASSPRAS